ncbi:MAG: histidine phosphatase family protein [Treponema sp.]|nr:histidine phosphatase family protein [Treponema sp.]
MLYVMRHGRTDWNDLHKLQGSTDIPLNETGRQMAQKAHDEYASVHFDVCFCSPLVRALETAQILLRDRNIPIVTDERLREMGFGSYEGIENSFDVPPIDVFFKDPAHYVAQDGAEPFEHLFARTGEFLDEKVKPLLAQQKDVLIVGHGAMNASIICQMKKLPLEQFWSGGLQNCKLLKIE